MNSLRILKRFNKNILHRTFANDAKGEITALYDFHVENDGKIVNFGGFMLPVQYNDLSIVQSHIHTRNSASLFDVSHMLQTEVFGKGCLDYLESICTADLNNLSQNSAALTVFTNENGGILDDLIITKLKDDHLYIVSNAARKDHDQKHLMKALFCSDSSEKLIKPWNTGCLIGRCKPFIGGVRDRYKGQNKCDIKIKFHEPKERSLVALQGPKAVTALQSITESDLSKLYFMTSTTSKVANVDCRITRCGYTGEDGFEISIPAEKSTGVVKTLLQNNDVKLAGLGARDSLRLEAGLCLYGNDITTETTPIEAALTWLVAKKRREARNFPGAEVILKQIKEGTNIKRIGLIAENGPPARQGAIIEDENGKEIGKITSGCPAPSLKRNISMGYVAKSHSKIGTNVLLKIRDKSYPAVVSKMPFVASNYYNKPK